MKKKVALATAAVMLIGAFPAISYAAGNFSDTNYTFKVISDGT